MVANLYVVRHADAGTRSSWDGDDRRRPLSPRGRQQAEAIAAGLTVGAPCRLTASPWLRCLQTLEPLARRLGGTVQPDDRLGEGASGMDALDLARELLGAAPNVVLCSHGDVIPDLLGRIRDAGARFDEPFVGWSKASVWRVEWEDGSPRRGVYLPPPERSARRPGAS